MGIVASSPPRITGFAAVPYQFDLGESTHLVVNYEGGAGPSSLSFASLPGGCTSSNTADLNCTPAATGTYTVTVQVTDALGDFGSATTALTVEPGLAVSATFVPLTFPATDVGWAVGMIASATGGVGPYQYLWSFGDGNSTPGVHVEHGYLTPGEYVLTLLVTDSLGGMGSASWAIQVNPQIAVQVDAPLFATDVGRPLALSATVTGGTEANRSVLWSFGDQTTQTSSQATHVWTAAGVYNVTARAVDGVGASATRSVLVTVNAAPAARFTVTGGSVSAPPRPGTEFFYNTTLFRGHRTVRGAVAVRGWERGVRNERHAHLLRGRQLHGDGHSDGRRRGYGQRDPERRGPPSAPELLREFVVDLHGRGVPRRCPRGGRGFAAGLRRLR